MHLSCKWWLEGSRMCTRASWIFSDIWGRNTSSGCRALKWSVYGKLTNADEGIFQCQAISCMKQIETDVMTISLSTGKNILHRISDRVHLMKPQHYSNVPYTVLFLIIAVYCTSESLWSECLFYFLCFCKAPCHLHSSDSGSKNNTHLVFRLVRYFGNSVGISYTYVEQ